MTFGARILAAVLLLASSRASAASCSLLAVPELNFGAYSALAGVVDAEGHLLLSCVPDLLHAPSVSYSIALGPGSGNPSGYAGPRQLVAGAFALHYNLYTNPARTIVWGDGTGGTAVVGGACAGTCAMTVYGRIFPGQSAPAARYSDDVLVTVDF